MGMRVPDLGRVDAAPRRLDELVRREPPRQGRKAGIPQALLRPFAPGGNAAEKAGGAQNT